MCGIAGVMDSGGHPIDPQILLRMTQTIRHRGPDGDGFYSNPKAQGRPGPGPSAALGHRRLKVIDLATGDQPISNEDGTVWVVFNGEIYNYPDLRAELIQHGHRFRTQSDTEVIVHAYEQFGTECVNRFWGMFSFALWDERRQRGLLARDRLGKKPLVYAESAGCLIFASEIQALRAHPAVRRDINPEAIHHYLTFGSVPFPLSGFQGIAKLPPAHVLIYENGCSRLQRYWQPDFSTKRRIHTRQACHELIDLLEDAVRIRLRSDVPLGVFLSGGMDSSTVVALASRLGQKVRTFSIGFEESPYNELPFARTVARQFSTEHHEEIVRPDAAAILPDLVRHYGEPFADSSALPSYYLAQFAKRSVTVVLNGDGGDEAFGGYVRHLAMRWADRFYGPLSRMGIRTRMENAGPGQRTFQRFLQGAALPRAQRWTRWTGLLTEEEKRALYLPDMNEQTRHLNSVQLLEEIFQPLQALDGVDAACAADSAFYLPNDLLVKMDIATMAHGLEARSPLLDHRIVELMASLPSRMKIRGFTLKYLLKMSQKKVLADAIVQRPKQGFAVPISGWFRGPWKDWLKETLCASDAKIRRFLQPQQVQKLVELHTAGQRDVGHSLWALVMLELWLRNLD